ncbi:MAG: Crp/Fnr family transcriptional regulator [Pedobacter sp.]|nr:MAG: Crp/Fnr family transcriptional regulator [Pedobacter sp.]
MISDILKTFGNFTESEQILFSNEVKVRTVKKNEVLLQKGEVAKSVFFNLKGLICQQHDKEGLRIIDLHLENEWILGYKSFVSQKPSESYISAYTDGCVFELSMESMHYLIGCSLNFITLNRIMESATKRIHLFDNALNPIEKYNYILANKPELVQSFPLRMIASYLKITPETLSRVREKIVRPKSIS